jgi:ATP-dependent DNA helicase DinG
LSRPLTETMPGTFVSIDLETTGLDPARDSIIEVGTVTFSGGRVLDEWSSLVNPQREIPPFITRLTGIDQGMVDEAPPLASLRREIRSRLGDHTLVGHHVAFDLGFLNAERLALGSHRLDTATVASILLPDAGQYGLMSLVSYLQLEGPDGPLEPGRTHRALDDARRTAALYMALEQRAAELDFTILEEIVTAGGRLGWPETLFFEGALAAVARGGLGGGQAGRLRRLYNPDKPEGRMLVPAADLKPLDPALLTGMLEPGGAFSQRFPEFEYREQQVEMLAGIVEAFNRGQHLIVEAGTGTGKSIGYLLPAAFWSNQNRRRVVVSTNTINLQDQLIQKDLPELQRLLPFEVRAAVLKGKRNYLCTRLFQQMRHSGPGNADEMALYARILVWLPGSSSGDASDLSLRTPGERLAWARLNAENDACTAERCAQESCPLHHARRMAEMAHIVVVNHALLLADVASENRVLPEYLDLIIDEAHHLESAVTNGLSFRADKRFLESLLDEVRRPRAGLMGDLQRRVAASLPREIGEVIDGQAERLRDSGQQAGGRLEEFFETLAFFLRDFVRGNSSYAEQVRITAAIRTQPYYDEVLLAWENLNRHLQAIAEGLMKLAGGVADLTDSLDLEDGEDLRLALVSLARSLEESRINLESLLADPSDEMIYWAEIFRERITLNAAPLHVGPLVEKHIFRAKETVILTSATLQTAGGQDDNGPSFDYLRERLHAQHAEELAVGSPFDYEATTLLYLPTDIPEPNQPGYQGYVERAIIEVGRRLQGHTMALFTSYSQLLATAEAIRGPLEEAGVAVLAQSDGGSRQQLLRQFKREGSRAVLLGTRSFWEGVDVPGEALQVVFIVRFPFDVPSDPVFAARSETFDWPFLQYSVPEAVLRFRQGFGRLIRRRDDQGVVIVLDKRILTKGYGRYFLAALPRCTVLRQRSDRVGELTQRWLNRDRREGVS